MKILVLLASFSLAGFANACSCVPGISQTEKFCKADFAVLLKVVGGGFVLGNQRVYKIQLIATFRSKQNGWVNERFIYTATSSAACGITLERGKYYIITGYYQNGVSMRTGLCDIQSKFNTNPLPRYTPPFCSGVYVPGRGSTLNVESLFA